MVRGSVWERGILRATRVRYDKTKKGRVVDRGVPFWEDEDSSARTTSESSSGIHLGHARAETAGVSDSRATANWPAERGDFMMATVVV